MVVWVQLISSLAKMQLTNMGGTGGVPDLEGWAVSWLEIGSGLDFFVVTKLGGLFPG